MSHDRMAVRPDITQNQRARVDSLIFELTTEYERWKGGASCIQLPRELKRDLERTGYGWLSNSTYERLSRWCRTRCWRRREQFVQPRAQQISRLLFGRVIARSD